MVNKECCCYCYRRETCVGFGWYDKFCRDDKDNCSIRKCNCSIRKCNCKDNTIEVIEDADKSK